MGAARAVPQGEFAGHPLGTHPQLRSPPGSLSSCRQNTQHGEGLLRGRYRARPAAPGWRPSHRPRRSSPHPKRQQREVDRACLRQGPGARPAQQMGQVPVGAHRLKPPPRGSHCLEKQGALCALSTADQPNPQESVRSIRTGGPSTGQGLPMPTAGVPAASGRSRGRWRSHGDHNDQEQAEGVGHGAPRAAVHTLPGAEARLAGGTDAGSFPDWGRLLFTARGLRHPVAQPVVELGDRACA